MDIGAHCAIPECHQQDFLPFTCDCCDGVFCLAHRSYTGHNCPKAGQNDRRVLKCPICQEMIPFTMEQDVNVVWSQHDAATNCSFKASSYYSSLKDSNGNQPQVQNNKKPKQRCAATSCNEKLNLSNAFTCSSCHQRVCLKHRFEADHECQQFRQQQRQRYSLFGSASASAGSSATAAAIRNRVATAASNRASNTKSKTSDPEQCPFCNQRFKKLVEHVNRAHPDPSARPARQGSSAGAANTGYPGQSQSYARPQYQPPRQPPQPARGPSATSGAREICPQCHAAFHDVMALVNHVETAHSSGAPSRAIPVGLGDRSSRSSSSSRANQDEKCQIM